MWLLIFHSCCFKKFAFFYNDVTRVCFTLNMTRCATTPHTSVYPLETILCAELRIKLMTEQFDLRLTNQRKGVFHSCLRVVIVQIKYSSSLFIFLPQNEKQNCCFSFLVGKTNKKKLKRNCFQFFSTFNIKTTERMIHRRIY